MPEDFADAEGFFRWAGRRGRFDVVSGRSPKKDPAAVEATLEDLSPVESEPALPAVTLDEEVRPEPSATQLLLDPVEDPMDRARRVAPRPTGVHLDVSADAPSVQARRRAALKSDAFESFPALEPPRPGDAARGAAPQSGASVWTPGLVALVAMGVALLLVLLLMWRT